MFFLIMGGIFYTVGGYVYSTEQPNPYVHMKNMVAATNICEIIMIRRLSWFTILCRYPGQFGFHEIWHLAVIAGALTHWVMMFVYVLPWHSAAT
jgi:hemolysin III